MYLLSELEQSHRYIEKLSGKAMIVTSISDRGINNSLKARAVYYNDISGKFETIDIVDNQLSALDVYPPDLKTAAKAKIDELPQTN